MDKAPPSSFRCNSRPIEMTLSHGGKADKLCKRAPWERCKGFHFPDTSVNPNPTLCFGTGVERHLRYVSQISPSPHTQMHPCMILDRRHSKCRSPGHPSPAQPPPSIDNSQNFTEVPMASAPAPAEALLRGTAYFRT